MQTNMAEIAEGIFRLSTFVPEIAPPAGFTFNQFLIAAEEPLLFHCGPLRNVSTGLGGSFDNPSDRAVAVDQLRAC